MGENTDYNIIMEKGGEGPGPALWTPKHYPLQKEKEQISLPKLCIWIAAAGVAFYFIWR